MAITRTGLTLSELVERFNISQDLLNREFTDEHVLEFSGQLVKWELVAPHLGLSEAQIEVIERDNNSVEEKRKKMLTIWKQSFTFKATYGKLIEALLAIDRADLASKLCKVIADPSSYPDVPLMPHQGPIHSLLLPIRSVLPTSPEPTSPDPEPTSPDPEPTSPQSSSGISVGSDPTSPYQLTFTSAEPVSQSIRVKIIEAKFEAMVKRVEELLRQNNTPLIELQRIASRPRSDTKGQFGQIFEKKIRKIRRAKSIEELFDVLSYFWDYLQPDYLIEIVESCHNNDAQKVVSEYDRELSLFRKQITLKEYLGKRRCNLDEEDHYQINIRLGNEWYEKTLEDLERLRYEFADGFSLLRLVPKLNGVVKNSISVTICLPRSVSLDHNQLCKFFRSYNALRVVVDGECIYDVESQDKDSGNTVGDANESRHEKEKIGEETQLLCKMSDTSDMWKVRIQGKEQYCVAAPRNILIIVSSESLQGTDVVPRHDVELTVEDIEKLKKLNLPNPPEDDASIMVARYELDKTGDNNIVGIERSKPGAGLTREYVLKKIKAIMANTRKEGVTIRYFGPGKKDTGDWCFEDGFITFRDLTELYCNYFKGRVLFINTDCSYSGSWVKELMKFLDKEGVKPCGHSAREKGILMKIIASCKPTEVPYCLLHSVRAQLNDKNTGMTLMRYSGFEVAKEQHTYQVDSTWLRCNSPSFEEPCTYSPEYTWEKREARDRIFILRGTHCGRPAWYYVLLPDDEDTIKEFKEGASAGIHTLNIEKYGEVIKKGWGKDPPNDVKEWMRSNYGVG